MTPAREADGECPALAAFLARRAAMAAAMWQALDARDASTFALIREAYHARLLRLAAALRGVALADVYRPCPQPFEDR